MSAPVPGFGPAERAEALRVLAVALDEDHARDDLTARLGVPAGATGSATIRSRAPGILAGVPCCDLAVEALNAPLRVERLVRDGDALVAGSAIARLHGPLRPLLALERSLLNLLGLLCGTASLTARYVEAAGPLCQVLDTRKTIPGLRRLQKYAVRCGGGHNHRMHLADGFLLKDNHRGGEPDVAAAVAAARGGRPGRSVVVEVDGLDELRAALLARPDRVLLDNFSHALAHQAVALRDELAPGVRLEVSGGITLATLPGYARAGVDCASVGALTHSAGTLDLGLDLDHENGAGA